MNINFKKIQGEESRAVSGSIRNRARQRESAAERVLETNNTAVPYNPANTAMFTKKIAYLKKEKKCRISKKTDR